MRRTRFILALVTAATAVMGLVGSVAPASAHFCSIPAEINVGEEVMVNIGVAAEATAVRGVDIEIPDGFTLKEPVGYMGYEPTRRGRWVHFEGAEIQPYSCHYFGFSGEAVKRGRLVALITTTDVDGTKTRFTDTRSVALYPAQLIYAGVTAADFSEGGSGGLSAGAIGAIAVAAGAAAVGVAILVRRRVTMGR